MPTIQTPTGKLYYDVCDIVPDWIDHPQMIIFHHGIGANTHIWADWLPVLAMCYRLVRFDMRGFGRSEVPAKNFNWSFDVLSKISSLSRTHLMLRVFIWSANPLAGPRRGICPSSARKNIEPLSFQCRGARRRGQQRQRLGGNRRPRRSS